VKRPVVRAPVADRHGARDRLISWLLVIVALGVAGWLAAPSLQMVASVRQALWLEVQADTGPDDLQPALRAVVAVDGGFLDLPLVWDPPGSADFVFVKPAPDQTDLKIVDVTVDGVALPLQDLVADARWQGSTGDALAVSTAGVLRLPKAPRRLALHLSGGAPGAATVIWRGQSRTVELAGPNAATIEFDFKGQRSAWVMLPPRTIRAVALKTHDDARPTSLATVVLHSAAGTAWSARDLRDSATARRCDRAGDSSAIALHAGCAVEVPLPQPLNGASSYARAAIAAAVMVLGCLFLILVSSIAIRWRSTAPLDDRRAPAHRGIVLAARIVLVIGLGFAAVFHFCFWDGLPVLYSPDSWDYYGAGHRIAEGHGLASVASFRTPGYPLIIAAAIAAAGDGFVAIAALQHVLLLAAGIVVYFALRSRLGHLWAAIAGVAVALSPFASVNANVIWTESAFTAVTTAAIAVLLPRSDWDHEPREFWRTLVGAVLLGVAIMIRPAAQIFMAIDLAMIAVWWWLRPKRMAAAGTVLIHAATVIVVIGALAAPWLYEMHRREGVLALNTVRGFATLPPAEQVIAPASVGTFAAYTLYLYQNRLPQSLPANAPFAAYMAGYHYANGHIFTLTLPSASLYDSRYMTEALLQSVRRDVSATWRFWRAIFDYNTTFRPTGPEVLRYSDTLSSLQELALPPRPAGLPRVPASELMADWTDIPPAERYDRLDRLMKPLQDETRISKPAPRGIAATQLAHDIRGRWHTLTKWALLSVVLIVAVRRARPFLVVWAYLICFLAAHSVFGTANDRYMTPLEPLLYLLIAAAAYSTVQLVRGAVAFIGQVRQGR
jgi:hypothetical protein